ncbi:DNA methyltransferase [Marinobacterium sedimentorum]|uniref:DNA methyltransferase n=1 Tax=Marinobacterium sedimentorum TaxID=2927804 RepID=UPI0020C73BFD|nr:DNA methyltransferase [Marinobacterium sedimentorum]MCP8685961.1 DNA methyltransferase [Marinobacterium sedimentorum]
MDVNTNINPEFGSIDISFAARPADHILYRLKSNGFRWSAQKRHWYAPKNEEREALARSLSSPSSPTSPCNQIIEGACADVLRGIPEGYADLVVTDPPYLVGYKDRQGRSIKNDVDSAWVEPSFTEIYRVLKDDSLCVSFYGWNHVETFMSAWKKAGFRPVGHIVWQKNYASAKGFLGYRHEQAYLLAKGYPERPAHPLQDVQPWDYTGNRLHPTEKSVKVIAPLIESFSRPGDLVIDPFCGSGTTALAAKQLGRRYIGIDMEPEYVEVARSRLM